MRGGTEHLLTLYSSTASSQVRTSAESSHISASVSGFDAFLVFPMPADFISLSWFVDVRFNTSGLFSFGRELQRRSGAITSHRLTSAVSVGGKKLRREKKFPVCSYRNNQSTRQYQSDMAPDKKDMKRKGIILTH